LEFRITDLLFNSQFEIPDRKSGQSSHGIGSGSAGAYHAASLHTPNRLEPRKATRCSSAMTKIATLKRLWQRLRYLFALWRDASTVGRHCSIDESERRLDREIRTFMRSEYGQAIPKTQNYRKVREVLQGKDGARCNAQFASLRSSHKGRVESRWSMRLSTATALLLALLFTLNMGNLQGQPPEYQNTYPIENSESAFEIRQQETGRTRYMKLETQVPQVAEDTYVYDPAELHPGQAPQSRQIQAPERRTRDSGF